VLDHLFATARDECVWLQEVRDPPTLPGKRILRRGCADGIAFNNSDPMALASQSERRRQTGCTGAEHGDLSRAHPDGRVYPG
jgi:hypothetical protein